MSNINESEELFPEEDPPPTDKEREELLKRAEFEGKREGKKKKDKDNKNNKDKEQTSFKKGGKVRGAGIARKGVRPCKMR